MALRQIKVVLLASLALCSFGIAQQQPSAPKTPSPEIHPDRTVTFRLSAPKASEVILHGDWYAPGNGTEKMAKGDGGVWSLTVGPLEPDVYVYWFDVDGMNFVVDPNNPWIKQASMTTGTQNLFRVPGEAAAWEDVKPVPHGEVRKVWYQSSSFGWPRRMHVYTPPGYENSRDRYPVFYILNGGGEDDSGWAEVGRINFILDNLIAEGKAKPMIVVMPNAFAVNPVNPFTTPQDAGSVDRFRGDFFKDVIPYVEKNYRVLANRDQRAIGGLTLAPNLLLGSALDHLDLFSYVVVTGNGLRPESRDEFDQKYKNVLATPEGRKKIKLFWIGSGVNDRGNANSKLLNEVLKQYGVNVVYFEHSGGHAQTNFRLFFREATQRLFR